MGWIILASEKRAIRNKNSQTRIMRDFPNGAQWAEWRTGRAAPALIARRFASRPGASVGPKTPFEAPNANRGAGLEVQLFQNVFDVLLDGARAAPEDLANLAVPFSFRDPFHDFVFAFGQRPGIGRGGPLRNGLY